MFLVTECVREIGFHTLEIGAMFFSVQVVDVLSVLLRHVRRVSVSWLALRCNGGLLLAL